MHPAFILAELQVKGSSCAAIGRATGLTTSMVCKVVKGRRKNLEVARLISRTLGRSIEHLWPGKYPQQMLKKAA